MSLERNGDRHQDCEIAPLRLLILGSCVSRDALDLGDGPRNITLMDYYSRSSFASQICQAWRDDALVEAINPKFFQKTLIADIHKTYFQKVQARNFDILLMDVIDDRFNLLERTPDCFLTATTEVHAALRGQTLGRVIPNDSKEFARLWSAGFERMVTLLESNGDLSKLRINRVYWAELDSNGQGFENLSIGDIKKGNDLLEQKYSAMERILPRSAFYDYSRFCFVGDASHRWGKAPFHYIRDLYRATMGHLLNENVAAPI